MPTSAKSLEHLIETAKELGPIGVAVADAAQGLVVETLKKAQQLGFACAARFARPRGADPSPDAAAADASPGFRVEASPALHNLSRAAVRCWSDDLRQRRLRDRQRSGAR
jgi:hypothetical protein